MSLPYGGPTYQPRNLPGQGQTPRTLPTAITRAAAASRQAAAAADNPPPPPEKQPPSVPHYSAYQWLLAWAGVVVLLWAISRTAIGYRLLYWGVVLMILLVLVTQSTWFAGVFAPIASLGPGGSGSSGPPQGS